ncbi:beta-1,6-N-acetylglucosaminyltransferase [Fodinibius halophilus]|uniref:Peptide O-xylosyltransferase n=1 Tax=Fodinibius halophilus TaxID=1736908 RepID=A0A6M1T130_9BACT|nr:beta-1,6-N-acetylglucosaminyltransferase [Fodinibius halophilus]NGP89788.1 beta-1,6-N-acetylglucosaminyltransferase [Fodinibius halophilus]
MKINYLILAHTNFEHLDRLISALDQQGVNFFIHIDKTATQNYHNNKANVHVVEDRIDITWGGFGMVVATIKLLQLAYRTSGEGYYCLISGADYPVRSNERITKELAKGYERINIKAAPLPHKKMERFEYYHFDFKWRKLMTLSEKVITGLAKLFGIKRDIPFKIYVGSQWFVLSHQCVGYILQQLSNEPDYIDFFRYTKIPDEAFFHTIIGNSYFLKHTKPCVTYMDWGDGTGPELIAEEHVNRLKRVSKIEGTYGDFYPLFARKFNNNSKGVVKKIDEELRGIKV